MISTCFSGNNSIYLPTRCSSLSIHSRNFSPSLVGVRPKAVLIDGGTSIFKTIVFANPGLIYDLAIVQTTNQSFDFNGESDLDLEYAMGLTNPQPITLLQTGDIVEGSANVDISIFRGVYGCSTSRSRI